MDLHIAALTQLSALRLPGPPTGGSKYNKAENCVFGGTGRVPIKNGAYRMERLKHVDKSNLACVPGSPTSAQGSKGIFEKGMGVCSDLKVNHTCWTQRQRGWQKQCRSLESWR
jgi:hypothetical protein